MIFEVPYGRWCILAIDKRYDYKNNKYAFRVFANSVIDTYNVRYFRYKTRKKLTKHLLMDEDLFMGIHKYFTTLRFNEGELQNQKTVLERLFKEIEMHGLTILCKISIENEIIP